MTSPRPSARPQGAGTASSKPAGNSVKTGVVRVAGQEFPFSKAVDEETIWHEYSFQLKGTGPTRLVFQSTTGEEHGPYVGNVILRPVGAATAKTGTAVGTI